jgi:hypothetical protein
MTWLGMGWVFGLLVVLWLMFDAMTLATLAIILVFT